MDTETDAGTNAGDRSPAIAPSAPEDRLRDSYSKLRLRGGTLALVRDPENKEAWIKSSGTVTIRR